MPLYEYICGNCETRFEMLRPMSQADGPVACPRCASPNARRMISTFAAVSKDRSGSSRVIASSGGGCASCAGGTCATCGR